MQRGAALWEQDACYRCANSYLRLPVATLPARGARDCRTRWGTDCRPGRAQPRDQRCLRPPVAARFKVSVGRGGVLHAADSIELIRDEREARQRMPFVLRAAARFDQMLNDTNRSVLERSIIEMAFGQVIP